MSYNVDQAIAAYSRSFGNDEKGLMDWCVKNSCIDKFDEIKEKTENIQDAIIDKFWGSNKTFSGRELEAMIIAHCKEYEPELKIDGIKSLLDYIAWIAWHESYLQVD